jgi:hypothetical protein
MLVLTAGVVLLIVALLFMLEEVLAELVLADIVPVVLAEPKVLVLAVEMEALGAETEEARVLFIPEAEVGQEVTLVQVEPAQTQVALLTLQRELAAEAEAEAIAPHILQVWVAVA